MNGERRSLWYQAIMLFNIGKEIVLQHQGYFGQLYGINTWTLEETVNRGTLQVDLPRKLRHSHPALVENGFNKVSDMDVLLRGHGAGFQA